MTATATKTCKVCDSDRAPIVRGFCNRHYLQLRSGYLTEQGVRLRQVKERVRSIWHYPKDAICKMADCGGKARHHYFCDTHYDQYRHGILDVDGKVLREIRPSRISFINNGGYRLIRVAKSKYKMEHRLVLERVLGRPLADYESVHHKDGNKLNNHPDNLELRSTRSHGEGHAPTAGEVLELLSALKHNDPAAYTMVIGELDKEVGHGKT